MSAEQTIQPTPAITYRAFYVANRGSYYEVGDLRGCWIRADTPEIDRFKTHSAALYAARLLNDGLAKIDPHAVLGCRVVPK